MNEYQRQFIASRGNDPDNPVYIKAADLGIVPFSPEDACRRHMWGSASYALDVASHLAAGNPKKANEALKVLRTKVTEDGETLAYEALMKLQATDIIDDTLSGDVVGNKKTGMKATKILEEIVILHSKRP